MKYRQNGLSNIVIVILVAVLVIGSLILYNLKNSQTSTNSQSTSTTTQNNSGDYNYYNPLLGAKFSYPSDWQKTEFQEPSIIHMQLVKNKEASFIFLTDEKNNLSNKTMDQYTKDSIYTISNGSAFKLIDQKDIVINGVTYHQVIYTVNDQQNIPYKELQIWTLTSKRGYGFAYATKVDKYDTYLPQAQKILESLTLF